MQVFTDSLHKIAYSTDASAYREIPRGVAYPETVQDIRELISLAAERGTHLIPRAGGTSIAGQVVGDGIVVDVARHFNHILEINAAERWVRTEPGVIRDVLNAALKPHGLFFSPETSTTSRCCVGGMFGNNSCGSHSLIYGSTRDHVLVIPHPRGLLPGMFRQHPGGVFHRFLQQRVRNGCSVVGINIVHGVPVHFPHHGDVRNDCRCSERERFQRRDSEAFRPGREEQRFRVGHEPFHVRVGNIAEEQDVRQGKAQVRRDIEGHPARHGKQAVRVGGRLVHDPLQVLVGIEIPDEEVITAGHKAGILPLVPRLLREDVFPAASDDPDAVRPDTGFAGQIRRGGFRYGHDRIGGMPFDKDFEEEPPPVDSRRTLLLHGLLNHTIFEPGAAKDFEKVPAVASV